MLLQLRSHLSPKAGTLEGSEQKGSRYGPSDGLSSNAMWTTDLAQSRSRDVSEENRCESPGGAHSVDASASGSRSGSLL